LGARPRLEELADVDGADAFASHLGSLDVDTSSPVARQSTTTAERVAATELLVSAADRGYQVAIAALAGSTPSATRGTA
ncbi:MAG: hypothetical protein ABW004_16775, partial [Aeromicrobium sp.]